MIRRILLLASLSLFAAPVVAEGGTVQMALQPTFWAQRFGTLVDRFGIPWMINCENAAG